MCYIRKHTYTHTNGQILELGGFLACLQPSNPLNLGFTLHYNKNTPYKKERSVLKSSFMSSHLVCE